MIAKYKLCVFALLTALGVAAVTAESAAQCATCPAPAAAYTAYSPVVYQTYRQGWYPGYFLDRVRTRLFGAPVATTVAYAPTATYASYAPTYTASYAPATSYAVSYAPAASYAVNYAPAASYAPAATYAPAAGCATCPTYTASYAPAVQEVVMRPVVCDPCTTCPAAAPVSQAVYQETPACVGCAPAQQSTTGVEPRPELPPSESPPPERTYRERPETNGESSLLEPEPEPQEEDDSSLESGESALNLEAPRLLDPNDRTAERKVGPVWTAVYHKPASSQPTMQRVSWQQAQIDAAGWTSASK